MLRSGAILTRFWSASRNGGAAAALTGQHGWRTFPCVSSSILDVQEYLPPLIPQHSHQHQQFRFRWTKAKKKRFERYHRNQELKAKGKLPPKPPYFFPKDTPVVTAKSPEDRREEARIADEKAAEDLKRRQAAVQEMTQSQPVLRHHISAARLRVSDRVKQLLDLRNGNQKQVVQAQKQQAMQLFQLRPADTGSSAVQVVALTTRIQQVSTHLQTHRKDVHSKRGLMALYTRRRKLLDYMERKDFDSYRKVVKTLGLHRTVRG